VADRWAGVDNEYVITQYGNSSFAVYTPGGSLVTIFPNGSPGVYGIAVDPGYPSSYGPTLWGIDYYSGYCYQIDLGNGDGTDQTNVTPASLGKVKALFR